MPSRIKTERRTRSVPEGLWINCSACDAVLYRAELERNLNVCPKCSHHMRIGARERLNRFLHARTQASRGYWDNRDYPGVLGTLHQEVSAVNLRNVLAQLRADASLTAAPEPRSGALVAPGPAPVP